MKKLVLIGNMTFLDEQIDGVQKAIIHKVNNVMQIEESDLDDVLEGIIENSDDVYLIPDDYKGIVEYDEQPTNESYIQYCVAYTIIEENEDLGYTDMVDCIANFDNLNDASELYERLLKFENLYTANLCKVIKTTEK